MVASSGIEYRKTNEFNVTNEPIVYLFNKDRNELCCLERILLVTMHNEDNVGTIELKNETTNGREPVRNRKCCNDDACHTGSHEQPTSKFGAKAGTQLPSKAHTTQEE